MVFARKESLNVSLNWSVNPAGRQNREIHQPQFEWIDALLRTYVAIESKALLIILSHFIIDFNLNVTFRVLGMIKITLQIHILMRFYHFYRTN